MPSAIDPTFPADGTPVSKPAFRDQLMTLRAELEHGGFVTNPITLAESTTSQALADVHAATVPARVGTIAELQAIPPAPGLAVEVLGYHAPGDGGGGLFYADVSGALETDGGIIFGCTADQSAVQTESGKEAFRFINGFALAQQNLVWGSVEVDPESPSAGLVFHDIELHGHRLNSGGFGLFPLINHKAGTFPADAQQRIDNYVNSYGAGTVTSTVRYRFLTNARRWVRRTDGNMLDVRWFGVRDDGTDQRNRICWALNAAKRLGYKEVRLNGAYRYVGGIELPEGIAFGWGKLTVIDDDVLDFLRTDWDTVYPAGTVREALAGNETCISPEDNSADWKLYNLELDGNYQGNLVPLEDNALYARALGVQSTLQNTPAWNGFSTSNHSGRIVPHPQYGVMEEVHIHGYGGNCFLGHGNTSVTGRNVMLGDSVRNHVFYGLHGTMTNVTVHGFSWAAWGKSEHCHFYGLHFKHLRDFDFTADGWNVAAQLMTFEGMRRGPGTLLTGAEADRWRQVGVSIEGGQWDLDGFTEAHMNGPLIYGGGQHLSVRNVTIMGPPGTGAAGQTTIASEITLGGDSELYEGWSFKNVTVMQRGVPLVWTNKDPSNGTLTIEDCSIQDLRGYEGDGAAAGPLFLQIAGPRRAGPNAQLPRRAVLSRNRFIRPLTTLAKVDVTDANATPIEIVVQDCTIPFTGTKILSSENGTGTIAGMTLPLELDKIRVYFERTMIGFGTGSLTDLELFFALTRFRNCTTLDGLTSEDGGTLNLVAAGGETHLDAPTGLLWAPAVVHVTPRSAQAAARYAWVEVLASDGATAIAAVADRRSPVLRLHFDQPLGAGETIALAWDAAVRPF